jgi:hypothetical protein
MADQLTRDDPIKSLWDGVVPERADELRALLDQHTAQFRALEDHSGFILQAGAYGAIQYTDRSLRLLWLFGYGGMISLHCYSSFVVILRDNGHDLCLSDIDTISGQLEANQRFCWLMQAIEELKASLGEADFAWPETIPDPLHGRPVDTEEALVFDLTCVAATYMILHELKHVIFHSEGNAPEDPWEEEHACDAFAQEMILGKTEIYSQQSRFPEEKVREKRAMGIVLALMFFLFVTPQRFICGSETHPSIHERWLSLIRNIDLNEDGHFWLYFSSLAISMIRFKGIEVLPVSFVSYKDLTCKLVQMLENAI